MTMRLQEIHPALVHFPITMLPVTIATDTIGRLAGSRALLRAGRIGIVLTAGGATVAAAAGVLAQESSEFDADARDLLVTHRNLNLGVVGLTALMAARRARRSAPSASYLLAGLLGTAVIGYSAYLGGRMVYGHGVGVEAAGNVREGETPEVLPGNAREIVDVASTHLARGLRDIVETLARGEVLPWLTRSFGGGAGSRPAPGSGPASGGRPSARSDAHSAEQPLRPNSDFDA